ncbi:hypothetical protein NQ318_010879, partial [Aromia moschata]
TILKNTRSLKTLGQPVDTWGTLLIYILTQKLDLDTKKEWEQESCGKEFPTLENFTHFLTKRCQLLEKIESNTKPQRVVIKRENERGSNVLAHVTTQNVTCTFCNANHFNHQCNEMKKLSVRERYNETKKLKLCTNCLRPGHINRDCKSGTCRICQKRHNTLLHFENDTRENVSKSETKTNNNSDTQKTQSIEVTPTQVTTHSMQQKQSQIILSTAVIYILDHRKHPVKCRALLDSGSQSNFMTTDLFKRLNLTSTRIDIPISGISSSLTHINEKTQATIKSRQNNYTATRNFLIIEKITENLPQSSFDISGAMQNVTLADPHLNEPGPIDVLLGVDIFWELICIGQINNGKGNPILQKTRLGWIVAGSFTASNSAKNSICNLSIDACPNDNQILREQLENFWKVEEFEVNKIYSKEENECEQDFLRNFKRDQSGRFEVSLPLRDNFKMLGNSYEMALNRFSHLENKLTRNPKLKTLYSEFIADSKILGLQWNSQTDILHYTVNDEQFWPMPRDETQIAEIPERRQIKQLSFLAIPEINIFNHYSSLNKLQRVFTYCLRFIKNIKAAKNDRKIGALEKEEINEATLKLIRLQLFQHFWSRWSAEYISTLQGRSKWMFQHPQQIGVNTLVLLKDSNAPPLQWKLGRIVAVHPGSDGVVRVVSVKTPNDSVLKRAVHTVCILPIETDSISD